MALQSRDRTIDPQLRIALGTETGVESIHRFASNLDANVIASIPIEEDTSIYDQLLLVAVNQILEEIKKTNDYLADITGC